jgi:23S rRNA (guanosine2251-2'-O)-methyltransferase
MNETIIFGIHSVEALIKKQPQRIVRLAVLQDRNDQRIQSIIALAKQNKIKIDFLSRKELDQLIENENHQGVAAFCKITKCYTEHDLELIVEKASKKIFLLILDGIQDPHNLGACLRSADAAGVDAVIAPKDKSVGLTAAVCKVASGAAESVPFIQVTNLARTLRYLKEKNIWIFGAAEDASQSLFQADLSGSIALVLGAEGGGLRRLTREHCDVLLNIPMQGLVSSLNVSVAAGIFLFEAVRQRIILQKLPICDSIGLQ